MAHSQKLFKKPKDMTYTDMSIWLDNNFYKEDCDYNTAYSYLWLLSYMLACKNKYFNSEKDYEKFSSFVAYDAFKRMTNKDKSRIKSGLNYIKSIMPFRKMAYDAEKNVKIIDSEFDSSWDGFEYRNLRRESFEKSNHELIVENIIQILENTPKYIDKCIPKVFKKDVLYLNIYNSCLLSMINKMTLKQQYKENLYYKLDNVPSFNDVKYYRKHLDNDIILWHLPDTMKNVVQVVLNKVNNILVNEIKEVTSDILVSDSEFNCILGSAFESTTGGNSEADY